MNKNLGTCGRRSKVMQIETRMTKLLFIAKIETVAVIDTDGI